MQSHVDGEKYGKMVPAVQKLTESYLMSTPANACFGCLPSEVFSPSFTLLERAFRFIFPRVGVCYGILQQNMRCCFSTWGRWEYCKIAVLRHLWYLYRVVDWSELRLAANSNENPD